MNQVCLDIASSYYWDGRRGWLNDPEDARVNFQGESFRFHAATVFENTTGKHFDFTDHRELYDFLIEADEFVTFNGRTCDLIVLESLIGENNSAKLWKKIHHDLKGWRGNWSLRNAFPP